MGQEAGASPRPRFRPSRLRVLGRVTPRLPTSFSLLENEGLDSGSPVRSALCTGIRPRLEAGPDVPFAEGSNSILRGSGDHPRPRPDTP